MQYRRLLILTLVALILISTYFFLISDQDPGKTGILFSFSRNEKLEKIELENKLGKYTFTKSNDKWVMTEPGNYRLNQRKMAILEKLIFELPVNRILEAEIEDYGFDSPAIKVEFDTTKNRHYSFIIGNFTPSQSQIYLKDATDNRVYVCDTAVISQLNGSLDAYRDTSIFDVDLADLSTISFYEAGQKLVSLKNIGLDSWRLTYPYEAPARTIEIKEFIIKFTKISAVKFVSLDNNDYSSMGLAPAHHSVELSDFKGNMQRLDIGGKDEGLLYVRTGSEEDIARVFDIDIDFSGLNAEKLLFETPLRTTIDQVARIDVARDGKKISIEIDQSNNSPRYFYNGTELASDLFIAFFIRYSGLSADGYDEVTNLSKPQIVFTTTFIDGKTNEVKLFYRNGNSYLIQSKERSNFFIEKEKVDELFTRLNKAIEENSMMEISP